MQCRCLYDSNSFIALSMHAELSRWKKCALNIFFKFWNAEVNFKLSQLKNFTSETSIWIIYPEILRIQNYLTDVSEERKIELFFSQELYWILRKFQLE